LVVNIHPGISVDLDVGFVYTMRHHTVSRSMRCYGWLATMCGPAIVMVRVVRMSVTSEYLRNSARWTYRYYETRIGNLASRCKICHHIRDRKYVPPFWVFPDWHFSHSDRNGPVGIVNVVNGSVGTVTSRHHNGHRGGPVIVTYHNGRHLVGPCQYCVKRGGQSNLGDGRIASTGR